MKAWDALQVDVENAHTATPTSSRPENVIVGLRSRAVLTVETGWPLFLAREAILESTKFAFYKSTAGVLQAGTTQTAPVIEYEPVSARLFQDDESIQIFARDLKACTYQMQTKCEIR